MSQLKEDLEKVAETLELGWAQCGWSEGMSEINLDLITKHGDSTGFFHGCLYIHVRSALGKEVSQDVSQGYRLRDIRQALGFDNQYEMYYWNDLPTTTWDDVKNRVREAIEKL